MKIFYNKIWSHTIVFENVDICINEHICLLAYHQSTRTLISSHMIKPSNYIYDMTLINVLTSVLKISAKEDKGATVLRTKILIIAHLPV